MMPHPLHAKGAEHSIDHGREDWVDAKEHAKADASERGMRYAATYKHQSAAHNVGAYNAAPDGSTPITLMFGFSIFASVETPVASPPPPTGTKI